MKRKLFSTLFALLLILLLFPTNASASFSDTGNHWAKEAINKWSELGILRGYDGKFRPDDSITRADMAVIIDRLMDYDDGWDYGFLDLPSNAYYTLAIQDARREGVMFGFGQYIRPLDKITREEAVVMFGRALKITENSKEANYSDADSISLWARGYVNALTEKGLVQGYNEAFRPKSNITRAEVAALLNKAIGEVFNEAKEYSGTINGNVFVNNTGAVLKDLTITGDLIIAKGLGHWTDDALDKSIDAINLTVTGNIIYRDKAIEYTVVHNSDELKSAIDDGKSAIAIFGTIGSPDKYTAYEINKQKLIIKGFSPEAKVYGSFIIKSDYVTIDGLTIYTHGGADGLLQSAIDIITRDVTISNNIIELPNPETLAAGGGPGNGITIWPLGHPDEYSHYQIYGNTFKDYKADTANWSSTAMSGGKES